MLVKTAALVHQLSPRKYYAIKAHIKEENKSSKHAPIIHLQLHG